jgi:SAM-dependent methyltransferase
VSPRVIRHLETARQRGRAGAPYHLHLPRHADESWTQDLMAYWKQFGSRLGVAIAPIAPPSGAGNVQVRSVGIRPAVAASIAVADVDVVFQRLELRSDEQFDLIVATNVLVYYDVFEQMLALANIARMLRPGGMFLSNDLLAHLPTASMTLVGSTDVVFTEGTSGSRLSWFARR